MVSHDASQDYLGSYDEDENQKDGPAENEDMNDVNIEEDE